MIAYHGTTVENALSILEAGFRVGTYFAYKLIEAEQYGVARFSVRFSDAPERWKGEPDGWQFHLRDLLGAEHIIDLRISLW